MRIVMQDVSKLAVDVGVGYGSLMRLAREIDEDATLPSLAHMTRSGLNRLFVILVKIRMTQRGRTITPRVEGVICK